MGATMPFSNYKVDSDLMESMRTAFHWVCKALQLNCDLEDRITEVIVTKIVQLAKAGARDPEILCGKVLADLETPAESVTERAPPEQHAPPPTRPAALANGPEYANSHRWDALRERQSGGYRWRLGSGERMGEGGAKVAGWSDGRRRPLCGLHPVKRRPVDAEGPGLDRPSTRRHPSVPTSRK
jgi:hypothetical protein